MRLAPLALLAVTVAGRAAPTITWFSDPVRPGETVLLRGGDFGAAPALEFARLDDGKRSPLLQRLPVLQCADDALKFTIPADTAPGVFECRVVADGATSATVLLNAPQVWWLQGDAGHPATPGGWVRVFGKCLGERPMVQLVPATGAPLTLTAELADGWSLRCAVPADLVPGTYQVRVHNGHGGQAAWAETSLTVVAPAPWPTGVYNVLATYGATAVADMRKSLVKYGQPLDRTDGLAAALAKAKSAGGGIVYFPAGRYHLKTPLELPPHTVLRGEGMGLVTLSWGAGRFNLDGGGDQGLARDAEPPPPTNFISGPSFALEDLSLYVPLNHRTVVDGGEVKLRRVRMRIGHLWALDGNKRPEGLLARLGHNFEVTDCDLVAKGQALWPGNDGVIARNRILAGKVPCPLGGSQRVIVEDNQFVSTYPTAYQNIAGVGDSFYYARNRHEAASAHQADFSFTFDSGCSCYRGTLDQVAGTALTLQTDPTWPAWAKAGSWYWQRAVVVVLTGRGASQYRAVKSYEGRRWTLVEPFAVTPDTHSEVAIVPLCGRALVIGNRFEDANWVNGGFGCGLDVIYAGNTLVRCAELLNYGIASDRGLGPNLNVQYLDNELREGLTSIVVGGSVRPAKLFDGAITQNVLVRRNRFAADNVGAIRLGGALREVVVEGCNAETRVDKGVGGAWVRP